MRIVTHSGNFHADDVLAVGMVRAFIEREDSLERSRDPEVWASGDIVVDVGGVWDPEHGRFDHHQRTYEGNRSSAGMVLDWLEASGRLEADFAARLRADWVDYVDAVDIGARAPESGVPCFSSMIGMMAGGYEDKDAAFSRAADMACDILKALQNRYRKEQEARRVVQDAMSQAIQEGRAYLNLDEYVPWKDAYFSLEGANHPTDFVIYPGEEGVRVQAITDARDSFENKRSLPESWGGLEGEALQKVVGDEAAVFCHKNLFICGFRSREAAVDVMERWGLSHRPAACGGKG